MMFIKLKIALSAFILTLFSGALLSQNLSINEISSSNISIIQDEDGDYEDWIELYYSGDEPLHLDGYGLSDDTTVPLKWTLSDTILQPGEFLLIWASSKNRNLHTSFKLSSSGETLLLSNPEGEKIDEVFLPELYPDLSFGRYPDGDGQWKISVDPSPSLSNGDSLLTGFREMPVFSLPEGFYTDSVVLTLSAPEDEDTIFYTLDGSLPSRESLLYNDTLILKSSSTIRASIFSESSVAGKVGTKTYFINESSTFSTISLTTDPYNLYDPDSGIFIFSTPYYNSNLFQDWERPIHLQFFDEAQIHGFSMDAGVKVHGGLTRNVPGKSLAIMARSAYGNSKINYQMFEDKDLQTFNNLVLRNSGNDYRWTMFRDCFMHSIVKDELNLDLSEYRPAVVFLNGEYWGIRNIREKMNEHFLTGIYKLAPENIDVLEYKHHNSEVQVLNGSADSFNDLIDFISKNDLQDQDNYDYVNSRIDIPNYIHYLIAQIYFDNSDWPGNNIKWWRRNSPAGKWRWLMFDTDFGFSLSPFRNETGIELEHYKHNTLQIALASNGEEWPNPPHSTFLLRNLMKNQVFKYQFLNTFCDHLNTTFQPERILPILTAYENRYAPEMDRHHQLNYTTGDWPGDVDVMETFANERVPNMQTHLALHIGLRRGSKLTLDVSDPETGSIGINSIVCDHYPWVGTYLSKVPVKIRAIPQAGYKFLGWSDGIDSISRTINVGEISELTASFEMGVFEPENIMINEINYISSDDYDTEDWVELYNSSETSADLSAWVFKDSDDDHGFAIPDNTLIEPKGTLVLCREMESFTLLRSDLPDLLGNLNFGLSSNGELLRLFDSSGTLIDFVDYGASEPWPDLSGSEGLTIRLSDPELDNALASSWQISDRKGGTPGAGTVNEISTGIYAPAVQKHSLGQNQPNPFRTQTTIYYHIGKETRAQIRVYNLSGQLLTTLVDQRHAPGNYSCSWNGKNASGAEVSGGIYLYRISTPEHQETKRMILIK